MVNHIANSMLDTKCTLSNSPPAQGRNGLGAIYTWAGGNGGHYGDSCAADGYVSSIYTIAVGSVDQNGMQAFYDENCSAKMATAYSYNSAGYYHMVGGNMATEHYVCFLLPFQPSPKL